MNSCVDLLSPPAWWCGLKSLEDSQEGTDDVVTTCVVVWIEIESRTFGFNFNGVTTCVVVWIEIESEELDVITDVGHHLRGGVD